MNKNAKLLLPLLVLLAALAGFSVARAAFATSETHVRAGGCGILLSGSIPVEEGAGLLSTQIIREGGGGLLLVSTLAEVNEFGLIDTETAVRGIAPSRLAEIEVSFGAGRGFIISAQPGTWDDAVAAQAALAISPF